ncbi:hypothetical protein LF65_02256 [Clostridium beijerinckii]|uniref:Uncharacterized protein n=1 Tax=Clostridium beijerinckii TaxID=1520 RepID=A0A0B5QLI3_CLOBE|nr:hypothetical protein [Clostridium beijerinckii]AJG98842.2 hypothetical protein LF65_02256 [Clostridium beijerinckii]
MDRPKDLPNRLECAYCKRSNRHGGECRGKDINRNEAGCLYFTMDEKGCIRNSDITIPFNLFSEIPPLGMWETDRWTLYDVDTDIRINKIYGMNWNKERGLLNVKCNADYYINEFKNEYKKEANKPILKVIK